MVVVAECAMTAWLFIMLILVVCLIGLLTGQAVGARFRLFPEPDVWVWLSVSWLWLHTQQPWRRALPDNDQPESDGRQLPLVIWSERTQRSSGHLPHRPRLIQSITGTDVRLSLRQGENWWGSTPVVVMTRSSPLGVGRTLPVPFVPCTGVNL